MNILQYDQVQYNVGVTMDKKDANIVDSSCECKPSSMGRCSHIDGLLFALED